MNCIVDMRGNYKIFHFNMLNKYFSADYGTDYRVTNRPGQEMAVAKTISLIGDVDSGRMGSKTDSHFRDWPRKKESWRDFRVADDLHTNDQTTINQLLQSYVNILTDIHGLTTEATQIINVFNDTPIQVRQYSFLLHYEDAVKKEHTVLLNMGIVGDTDCPLMAVLKRSKSLWLDYRKLNKIKLDQSELMSNLEDMFARLSKAHVYFFRNLTYIRATGKSRWQMSQISTQLSLVLLVL